MLKRLYDVLDIKIVTAWQIKNYIMRLGEYAWIYGKIHKKKTEIQ